MKWFKHHSDSLDDPFILELMDEYSHVGYVAFFGLLEIISKENGYKLTGKLEINPRVLRRKLKSSQTKLRHIFDFCQRKGRLSFDFSGENWKFHVPKMVQLKDNYTQDLEATGKKLSLEEEKEEEKDITPPEKTSSKGVKTNGKFQVPTLEEIRSYCTERDNGIDPIKFFNHYESNGWMVGKNKMKKWKSAIGTWERNSNSFGNNTQSVAPSKQFNILDEMEKHENN